MARDPKQFLEALSRGDYAGVSAYNEVDGRELFLGAYRAELEALDLEGEKTPDERAWAALGAASGMAALGVWPDEVGVAGLPKALPTGREDPRLAAAGELAFFDYHVAAAKLCAILAAATGEAGQRLVVAAGDEDPTKWADSPVVAVVGEAPAADGRAWSVEGELAKHASVAMSRLRGEAAARSPSAEESLAKMGSALEQIDEL